MMNLVARQQIHMHGKTCHVHKGLGKLAEKARRSYGMLMYTHNLGASELVSMYSTMRMAAGMKLVDLPTRMVDEAMFTCLPHTLAAAENLDAKESLGERRAAKVRSILAEAPMHL